MYLKYLSIFTLALFLVACGGDKPNKGEDNNTDNTAASVKDIPTLIKDLDKQFPKDAKPTTQVQCMEWGSVSIFSVDGKKMDKIRYDYAIGDEGGTQFFYYQDGKLAAIYWKSIYYKMNPDVGGYIEVHSETTASFKDGKMEIKNLEGEVPIDGDGNFLEELVLKEGTVDDRTKERMAAIEKSLSAITETELQKVGEAMCKSLEM